MATPKTKRASIELAARVLARAASERSELMMFLPVINLQRCVACGVCETVCPTNAVTLEQQQAILSKPEACTFCDRCEAACPTEAISRSFAIRFAPSSQPLTKAQLGQLNLGDR
ncbi:ATP-binding protein [Herpetosiphon giganteus]|uniref:ATP-binding protein n=1 Tax=Herpetosiphon giganteus TaxID=2029754 RepID=UPI001EF8EF7A|nr:4Fe-4S binding protein [Herpetosiphon giganteus]MBM7842603.1 ferredoxin [Herpetosiphon giganteus]